VADVTVVGAGPVGMLLAGDLARRGVDVEVLERRPAAGGGSRAIGVHAPVLAALEPSGVTERLLAHAVRVRRGEARSRGRTLGVVRFEALSARFPFVATLPQAATEAVLAADAPEPVRGAKVMTVLPRPDGVLVRAGVRGRVTERISRIADWPDWHPPAEMRQRQPYLPVKMTGGVYNPLGAKALYLGNSLYRIHGTDDARTIGRATSSGCFRMTNGHVTDLARRVGVGTTVVVVNRLNGRMARVGD